MKILLLAALAIACGTIGVGCIRSIRQMQASGIAYNVLDWRTVSGPRPEYARADHPGAFRWLILQAAFFATISLVMTIGLTLAVLGSILVKVAGQ